MVKLSKRQMKEDKFITGLLRVQDYANQNTTQILIGVAGVVVVAVIVLFLFANSRSTQKKAENEYGVANMYIRDYFNMFEQDQNQDGIPDGNLDSAMISLTNAKLEFEKILDKYGNTRPAKFAAFYLGFILFQMRDYQQAESYYDKFLKKYYIDEGFEAAAKKGIAECKESQRDFEGAGKLYLEIGKQYPNFAQRGDVLCQAALNLAKAGSKEQALEAFHLLKEIPTATAMQNEVRMFLYEKSILDPYSQESE